MQKTKRTRIVKMAGRGNKSTRDRRRKDNNNGRSNAPKANNDATKAMAIQFNVPQSNSSTISVKVKDALDNEVKEVITQVDPFKDSSTHYIEVLKQLLQLAKQYDMLGDAAKSKALVQIVGRVLLGALKTEWFDITNGIRNHATLTEDKLIECFQELSEQHLGSKAYEKQLDTLQSGDVKLPLGKMTLVQASKRLFQMLDDMELLSTEADGLAFKQEQKIWKKCVNTKIVRVAVEQGAMNTKSRKAFLKSLENVEELHELDNQVALESQADRYDREYDYSNRDTRTSNNNNNNNNNNNDNDDDNNNNSDTKAGGLTNPCRIHDGKHEWSKCPKNRFSKNYEGNDNEHSSSREGEVNAIQSKSTTVTFANDDDSFYSESGESTRSSRRGELMMIQSTQNKSTVTFNANDIFDDDESYTSPSETPKAATSPSETVQERQKPWGSVD